MIASTDAILQYLGNLNDTTVEEDRDFVSNLGDFVEGLARDDIKGGALLSVEDALDQIFQKHRRNINRTEKQTLQEIRATCMELNEKLTSKSNFDRYDFNEVFSLGQKIIDFSPSLSLAASIIFLQNPPSFFG